MQIAQRCRWDSRRFTFSGRPHWPPKEWKDGSVAEWTTSDRCYVHTNHSAKLFDHNDQNDDRERTICSWHLVEASAWTWQTEKVWMKKFRKLPGFYVITQSNWRKRTIGHSRQVATLFTKFTEWLGWVDEWLAVDYLNYASGLDASDWVLDAEWRRSWSRKFGNRSGLKDRCEQKTLWRGSRSLENSEGSRKLVLGETRWRRIGERKTCVSK